MSENGFTLQKARSRQYPAETLTDADYMDDLALLTNIPAEAKSLLAAECIGLYMNAN